jgi:hypothetical protein
VVQDRKPVADAVQRRLQLTVRLAQLFLGPLALGDLLDGSATY